MVSDAFVRCSYVTGGRQCVLSVGHMSHQIDHRLADGEVCRVEDGICSHHTLNNPDCVLHAVYQDGYRDASRTHERAGLSEVDQAIVLAEEVWADEPTAAEIDLMRRVVTSDWLADRLAAVEAHCDELRNDLLNARRAIEIEWHPRVEAAEAGRADAWDEGRVAAQGRAHWHPVNPYRAALAKPEQDPVYIEASKSGYQMLPEQRAHPNTQIGRS